MNELESILHRQRWDVYDESSAGLAQNAMHSFAMDDTLCRIASSDPERGICRTWVHGNTIVLGIQDSRLPYIEEGVRFLEDAGYRVIVRNSGGLAVVLDPGVLNVSLIFKDEKRLSIDSGYEAMCAFVREWFKEFDLVIEDREIAASYCPGRYDLSVAGRKFAGISQRRLRGGVAVQIYLAVNGSGSERAGLIRSFYEQAVNGAPVKYSYPRIDPAQMASLSEITGRPLTVEGLYHSMLLTLKGFAGRLGNMALSEADWTVYEENLDRMIKRNEKVNLL
ncbi:lipoate--protein ligase family protein [Alteribacter natronophilus]|uniref:lipoate--protein ligase family protein n=1 Tax=Alteribacter natronophilus TaxID=2583810 RepID=UPI00110EB23F|nr:lipoate--protein ligase family protein [Alteribacter natronophilus]TMW72117.1 lipoate--protein ligase family protein [Alteribacter natronophilus]